MTHYKHSV